MNFSKVGPIEDVFYLNEYLTKDEEKELIKQIEEYEGKWISLNNRKLKNFGGIPHPDGTLKEPLPDYLQNLCNRLDKENITEKYGKMDQILINEYRNGAGIDLHKDGSLFYPFIIVISLNSSAIIEFYKERTNSFLWRNPPIQIFLQPRSLLIFSEKAYTDYYHGIREIYEDEITKNCFNINEAKVNLGEFIPRNEKRISLTIRKSKNIQKEHIDEKEKENRKEWWIDSINDYSSF